MGDNFLYCCYHLFWKAGLLLRFSMCPEFRFLPDNLEEFVMITPEPYFQYFTSDSVFSCFFFTFQLLEGKLHLLLWYLWNIFTAYVAYNRVRCSRVWSSKCVKAGVKIFNVFRDLSTVRNYVTLLLLHLVILCVPEDNFVLKTLIFALSSIAFSIILAL